MQSRPPPPHPDHPTGVGAIALGRTYTSLRRAASRSKLVPGCELGGPQTREANAPRAATGLRGAHAALAAAWPRSSSAAARPRARRIGATSAAIRKAFPRAKFDHRGDAVFGLTFARVPKPGGGRLEFGVDTKTKKVTLIGIPRIPFCD